MDVHESHEVNLTFEKTDFGCNSCGACSCCDPDQLKQPCKAFN